MDLIMILFVFCILVAITSTANILLKTTRKKDWLISFSLSFVLSIVFTTLLKG